VQKETCFSLGKITKLHGYKGAVVLHIDSTTPQYFKNLESVLLEIGSELVPFFFSERGKLNEKKLIVKFEDVEADHASRLVGAQAYLPKEMLPAPREGYYDKAIVGFSVFDGITNIGSIVEVIENTAQNLFVVQQGETEHLIPAVDAFIQKIDNQEKIIYLELPEGLLELQE
jgi:16S rRNA processing protein RimM